MPTPTIVIGVGNGGGRMASCLHEIVAEENDVDDFQFIFIDTNSTDLDDNVPEERNIRRIQLDKPPQRRFEQHKQEDEFHYLHGDEELETDEGTGRRRPVSRYHIEYPKNYDWFDETLEETLRDFVRDRKDQLDRSVDSSKFNLWILSALGGGTGSGAVPLVSVLTKNITERIQNTRFFFGGVGSLPRLDRLESRRDSPEGRSDLYVNTFACLAELQKISNLSEREDWSPPTIEIGSDVLKGNGTLSVDDPVFDRYWMAGLRERNRSSHRERQVNRTVANSIFYLSNKSTDNFPYVQTENDSRLATLASSEMVFPFNHTQTYLENKERINELEQDIKNLREDINAHRQTADYLEELRSLEIENGQIRADTEFVDSELFTGCENFLSSLDYTENINTQIQNSSGNVNMSDVSDYLENLINNLYHKVENQIRSPKKIHSEYLQDEINNERPEFNDRDVVSRVFFQLFYIELEEELLDHRFSGTIDEIWEDYAEILERRDPQLHDRLEDRPPAGKWRGGLEEFLTEYGNERLEELNSGLTKLRPLKGNKLEQEVEKIDNWLTNVPDLCSEYERISAVRDRAEARFEQARDSLIDAKTNRIEQGVMKAKQAEKEGAEKEQRRCQNKMEEAENVIRSSDVNGSEFRLEINNLENLDQELLKTGTIASLLGANVLKKETLARRASEALRSSYLQSEPVQDVEELRKEDIYTDSFLGILLNNENREKIDGGSLLDLEIPGQPDVGNVIQENFDHYLDDSEAVSIEEGYSMRCLCWFMPISLQNTSEYGTILEYYTDPDLDINSQLDGYNDEDVHRRFAYPELFSSKDQLPVPRHLDV